MFLIMIPVFLILIGGVMMIAAGNAVAGGVLIGCAILSILLISLVSSAVHAILIAAIYLFAAEGEAPEQFDQTLIAHAFNQK